MVLAFLLFFRYDVITLYRHFVIPWFCLHGNSIFTDFCGILTK